MNFQWRRDRQPFGPLVFRSQRGMLHRAKPGPRLHIRCSGGRPLRGKVLTPEEAVNHAIGRPAVLCRYPWCFRAAVEAAGLPPEVGHVARYIAKPRRRAAERHVASPARAHETVERWAWCDCGRVIVRRENGHNPDDEWWAHKPERAA